MARRSSIMEGMKLNQIKGRMGRLGELAQERWRSLVFGGMRQGKARGAYLRGMSVETKDNGTISLKLSGVLAGIVERGQGARDVRTALLKSPKAKTSKSGSRYIVVPFRHKVAAMRAQKINVAGPTGGTVRKGAKLYQTAKKLAYHGTKSPNARLGRGFGTRAAAMVRTKLGAARSRFITFRTASSAGRPWMSKGVRARRFMRTVIQEIPAMAKELL